MSEPQPDRHLTRTLDLGPAIDPTALRVDVYSDGVAELVLGPAGSMPTSDAAGHALMGALWPRLAAEPGLRAVLVRSEGKGFCAGGNFALVQEMVGSEAARLRILREARDLVQGMIDCDLPIVSAIHGAAVGAGAALALLADVSIAAHHAKIIDGHTKLGVAAGDHAAVIWPLLCGMAKAKYHLLTCAPLSGLEAERIGLVSLTVPDDELLSRAREVATTLAAGSPTALAWTKRSLNHWLRAAWPAFEHSLALEILGFAGADAREGVAALQDKRPPRFGA
ncbi:enoyl-CoA hydratase/isomerase family protein [Ideonella livida]|uniref:Enoyl-CoA hydratase/isomerase family protein n=1 Tax=Ideonella livida TaxID=2707176 RepID=A0A7C9TK22_9BURK|nr:enoyl-CoA hydratase/isomerase family protein [Ideonella livida]NDY91363.1 enoyl-CoA hydratase/isomerase family protein [Ideonella livida]